MQGIVVDEVTVTQFHQPPRYMMAMRSLIYFTTLRSWDMKIYVVKMLLQLLKQVNDLGLWTRQEPIRFIADDTLGLLAMALAMFSFGAVPRNSWGYRF